VQSIKISSPESFEILIREMDAIKKSAEFARCWLRLTHLILNHFGSDFPTREAEIYLPPDPRPRHFDFGWVIFDSTRDTKVSGECFQRGVVLAGGMNFHNDTQSWSINT
jgi:hypothetical protein